MIILYFRGVAEKSDGIMVAGCCGAPTQELATPDPMMRDDPARLIGAGNTAPVRVLRPDGASQFFLTADHAGRAIPRRLGNFGLPESELGRHIAWDIGIAGVTEKLARALDATAVLQAYSRLVIDCNRQPEWESSIPSDQRADHHPRQRRHPSRQSARRAAAKFRALPRMHRRIARPRAAPPGGPPYLIAMHSFTPVFKGEPRDIEIGILYNRDARLAGYSARPVALGGRSGGRRQRPLRDHRCERLHGAGPTARAAVCRMSRSRSARI